MRVHRSDGRTHHRDQVDVLEPGGLSLERGGHEQVLDHVGHPPGVSDQRLRLGMCGRGRRPAQVAFQQLRARREQSQRRTQLVRGIRDEPALAFHREPERRNRAPGHEATDHPCRDEPEQQSDREAGQQPVALVRSRVRRDDGLDDPVALDLGEDPDFDVADSHQAVVVAACGSRRSDARRDGQLHRGPRRDLRPRRRLHGEIDIIGVRRRGIARGDRRLQRLPQVARLLVADVDDDRARHDEDDGAQRRPDQQSQTQPSSPEQAVLGRGHARPMR